MSFFDPPAPPPEPDEPRDHEPPPWFGPPRDVLAALVPDRRVLARSDVATALLSHIDAYPTGCRFHVRIAAHRPASMDRETWLDLRDQLFGHRGRPHRRHRGGPLPDDVVRFGVQFADGTKATTTDGFRPPHMEDTPQGPVLQSHGSGGGGSEDHIALDHPLWLWPLPPAEDFDLVLEWPVAGIALTRVVMDGAAIRAAAERAGPLFS